MISKLRVKKNVKRMVENGFTSSSQQQVTDKIFLTNKEAFFRHYRLSKSSSRCVDKNDPIKPFFADFSFYLAPNYFIYSVSCGISFITYLLIMFISVCFSSRFVYFSKNCTGNFRKIAFSSKLNLGVLPWSLRKNVSIL